MDIENKVMISGKSVLFAGFNGFSSKSARVGRSVRLHSVGVLFIRWLFCLLGLVACASER